jgi:predicted alpha/beta-fold hydrolase
LPGEPHVSPDELIPRPDFRPHPFCRNAHVMTVVPRFRPVARLLAGIPVAPRLFRVAPDTQLLGYCHWQPDPRRHDTVVLLHGLEGCSDSHYMLGLAGKAWRAGLNVVRLNQRNCGGTEHLTPTLYHAGLSGDLAAVLEELQTRDGLESFWTVGYSMGGNLALKMAGEMGAAASALRGVAAVCPNIHPAVCVEALERPVNWFYQRYFLTRTKARLARKASLFNGKFDLSSLPTIRTLRVFDEMYTAPNGGFLNASDYYERAGARHVLGAITVPTLLITAQDDPFIPFRIFDIPAIKKNRRIRLIAPMHGGHCGFFQRAHCEEDAYWAEHRIVEFIVEGRDR